MKYMIFKRNVLGNMSKIEREKVRGKGYHGINVSVRNLTM